MLMNTRRRTRGATRGNKLAFALAPTALLIIATYTTVGCGRDSSSDDAKNRTSKSAAPFNFRIESPQEFVLSRGYALTEDDRAELATGEVPFKLIAKLLAMRDGAVFWDSRVLVMSPRTQERVSDMQQKVATYEEFLDGLRGLGIEPSDEQVSLGREPHPGTLGVTTDATIEGAGGAASSSSSTSSGTGGTGGTGGLGGTGGTGGLGGTGGTGGLGTGGAASSSSGDGGWRPCSLVTTITASSTFTYSKTKQTKTGPKTTSDSLTDTTKVGTPWVHSTFSHTKNMLLWDDQGSMPGSHSYIFSLTGTCLQGDAYSSDWASAQAASDTRSLGADAGEQAVTYTITVNPADSSGNCGTNWTATVSGLNPQDSVNGQASAVNNGTGSNTQSLWASEQGLSVFTTITPNTYMELNRPPQTCVVPEWNSSKKFTTTSTINFNLTNATSSVQSSGGNFTLTGSLNVGANGITETGPTLAGNGNIAASGNSFTSYLTSTSSYAQGGSGTIAFTHTAHPPTSYSFAASPPSCNTIAGKYSAGFGAFSSNTSRANGTAWGVSGPFGCHKNLPLGSINSNVTLRSTLDVSALACSCLAPTATSCSIKCEKPW
jgi:hypothetical protein